MAAAELNDENSRNLKQFAYERLKEKIISCEILPGTMLKEEDLCETLKISRTPLREALGRLELERWVAVKPKKGIYVNRVSLNNIQELFDVRLDFEPSVVLRYGNRIRDEIYSYYIQQFRRTDCTKEELYKLDEEFHQLFTDASNNRYLKDIRETIRDQSMRYRILSTSENRLAVTQAEHLEIATRCICSDWENAARLMKIHIENSKMAIVNYVIAMNLNVHNVFMDE